MTRLSSFAFLCVLYLMALCVYATPATQPSVLIVTAGGWYQGGTYTSYSIRTQAEVWINRATFLAFNADTGTSNTRPNLHIWNCTFNGTAPHYSNVFWRFNKIDIQHCQFNSGGGTVVMDSNPTSFHFCFNSGVNISGAISTTARDKTSFVQLDQVHCPDVLIRGNQLTNQPVISATEDAISMARSGGTANSYATIDNNFVDGVYQYPHKGNFSGSAIMGYDPASGNANEGGYTNITNNIAIASENVSIDVAGSKFVHLMNNIVCSDGTSTKVGVAGIRTWRWIGPGGGTPVSAFGPFIASNNQAYWPVGQAYALAQPQTASTNNLVVKMTDAECRQTWKDRIKANGWVIGPVSVAGSVSALTYVGSSPEVQPVPLPKEGLGAANSIGYTISGSWVRYPAMDFGQATTSLIVSQATMLAGQSFTVHLDSATGPLAATVTCPKGSGGWYGWTDVMVPVKIQGTHEIFLVFMGSVNMKTLTWK